MNEDMNEMRRNILILLAFCCLFLMGFVVSYWKTEAPVDSRSCIGQNYEAVVKQFQDAGFWNVAASAISASAAKPENYDPAMRDTVGSISIKGANEFLKGDAFSKVAPVRIYYYAAPKPQD